MSTEEDEDLRIARLRRNIQTVAKVAASQARRISKLEGELSRARAKASPQTPVAIATTPTRGRAAVISWDMAHNPVGRAAVLYDLLERDYDVDLLGPTWARYGGKVWKPIAESKRSIRSFRSQEFYDFWPAALATAQLASYDLVVVCKPRLPALLLGALIKKRCGCPLVLDIDDFELSFFKDETPTSLDELENNLIDAFREPYEELATRASESLVKFADSIVVSNVALRKRYGGTIVRHARSEASFRPEAYDRQAERQRLGIREQEFAIVFAGTPRPHKGIKHIAQALHELSDKRFCLHILADNPDRTVSALLAKFPGARVVLHPGCSLDDLPAHISAADAVVLLQDPQSPISQYQIPAKISDAAAFGLPILTTDVPPLRDLAEQGLVTFIEPNELGKHLKRLAQERDSQYGDEAARRIKAGFRAELGLAVNRQRLDFAIEEAARAPADLHGELARLLSLADRAYTEFCEKPLPENLGPRRCRDDQFDVVMFWKQNDTGIYGRRHEMVAKYLLESGRVGRVLLLDAPMEVSALGGISAGGDVGPAEKLTLWGTIDNQYELRDSPNLLRRTYLWDRRGGSSIIPNVGGSIGDYGTFVRAMMAKAQIEPERSLAWVCPVVFDFPAIIDAMPFRGIVGDLIDDQRAFDMQSAFRRKISLSYESTVPLFDVVFTNCEPVASAFRSLSPVIHVVPNGAELIGGTPGPKTSALAELSKPIAGYVGNLRDRVDWELLHHVATSLPNVTFAIIGGGEREEDVREFRALDNVHFLGPAPYEEVPSLISQFDVALAPHRRSELTSRMNPLKIYGYFAAHRPIVATEVENIDAEIRPYIRFANDPSLFAENIVDALEHGLQADSKYDSIVASLAWEHRIKRMLAILDEWLVRNPA